MKPFKPLILNTLYHLKIFDILRHIQRKRVIILMYHRFSDKKEPFKIQQSVFEKQIKFLLDKYNFISLREYSEILSGVRGDLPDNPIILTIDDGHWDNYIFAYPILKKYSVPATLFISTDFISHKAWLLSDKLQYVLSITKLSDFYFHLGDKTIHFRLDNFQEWLKSQLTLFNYCRTIRNNEINDLIDRLARHLKVDAPEQTVGDFQPLTWDQIREMYDNGIDFGSHTCSHSILSMISGDELKHEIVDSKREIESKLGVEINSFCYPNGQPEDLNNTVAEIVRDAGYSCAVTTINGFNNAEKTDRFFLKRLQLYTDNKIKLSRELTRLLI